MKTPDFFNEVTSITMCDPLAGVLGATEDGMIDYTYTDVVKLAGHSCPTVAGAYLMVQKGLKELYGDETPIRGEIKVLMNGKLGDGVVGIIANVASMITGATDIGGFHGLGGKFDRRQLLFYIQRKQRWQKLPLSQISSNAKNNKDSRVHKPNHTLKF